MAIWKSSHRYVGIGIGIGIRIQGLSFTQYKPPLELKVSSIHFLEIRYFCLSYNLQTVGLRYC